MKFNYKDFLNENDTFRFSKDILEVSPKLVYRQTSSSLISTIDFNKFHCFSAEMIIYCIQDVNVNVDVYNFVLNELLEWGYNTAEIPIYELPYLVEAKISDLILKSSMV